MKVINEVASDNVCKYSHVISHLSLPYLQCIENCTCHHTGWDLAAQLVVMALVAAALVVAVEQVAWEMPLAKAVVVSLWPRVVQVRS